MSSNDSPVSSVMSSMDIPLPFPYNIHETEKKRKPLCFEWVSSLFCFVGVENEIIGTGVGNVRYRGVTYVLKKGEAASAADLRGIRAAE